MHNIKINCEWLFQNSHPAFANKPNLVFQAQDIATQCLIHILKCKLAVWPMSPIYDSLGNFLEYKDHSQVCGKAVWQEWNNAWNQELVRGYCHNQCGIFETNKFLVIDADIPIERLDGLDTILHKTGRDYFNSIHYITDASHWLLTYLYEKHLFLFLASPVLEKETKNIRSLMADRNIVCGWLENDVYGSIAGGGLFLDNTDEINNKIDRVLDIKKNCNCLYCPCPKTLKSDSKPETEAKN